MKQEDAPLKVTGSCSCPKTRAIHQSWRSEQATTRNLLTIRIKEEVNLDQIPRHQRLPRHRVRTMLPNPRNDGQQLEQISLCCDHRGVHCLQAQRTPDSSSQSATRGTKLELIVVRNSRIVRQPLEPSSRLLRLSSGRRSTMIPTHMLSMRNV